MKLTLHVWRQKNAQDRGRMVRYEVPGVNEHMSFLEMLDVLNEGLIEKGEDPIVQAGGYVSVNTGGTPDGNALPVPKADQEKAMDAAACIGCGACVAACPNAAAALFVSAKVSHLAHLPQGQAERHRRALAMVRQMNREGFANCTNIGECEAACPKQIKLEVIAQANADYIKAAFTEWPETVSGSAG